MFRVKLYENPPEHYYQARNVWEAQQARTQQKLEAVLRKHRLILSHTDEQGFACYTPAPAKAKRRRVTLCSRCKGEVSGS